MPQRRDDYVYGSEGGGLTAILEAMAMGRPVVATERAILRDYIDDDVDGILVPPKIRRPCAVRSSGYSATESSRDHSARPPACVSSALTRRVVLPRGSHPFSGPSSKLAAR